MILDREQEIARQQLAAGHKDRALVALRRRKYQGGLLVKMDGQLENLEQLVRVPIIDFQIPLPPRLRTLLLSTESLAFTRVGVWFGTVGFVSPDGLTSQAFRDQFPTHSIDLAADVDSILLESMKLAVMVTVTG